MNPKVCLKGTKLQLFLKGQWYIFSTDTVSKLLTNCIFIFKLKQNVLYATFVDASFCFYLMIVLISYDCYISFVACTSRTVIRDYLWIYNAEMTSGNKLSKKKNQISIFIDWKQRRFYLTGFRHISKSVQLIKIIISF